MRHDCGVCVLDLHYLRGASLSFDHIGVSTGLNASGVCVGGKVAVSYITYSLMITIVT